MKGYFVSERLLKNFNCQEDKDLVVDEGEDVMHGMELTDEDGEVKDIGEDEKNSIKSFDDAADKGLAVIISVGKVEKRRVQDGESDDED